VVAFDEQGTIKGANRSALELLRFRDHETLFGQRVDHVFETSLAALLQLAARHRSPEPCRPRGGAWFAMVRRRWNRRRR